MHQTQYNTVSVCVNRLNVLEWNYVFSRPGIDAFGLQLLFVEYTVHIDFVVCRNLWMKSIRHKETEGVGMNDNEAR